MPYQLQVTPYFVMYILTDIPGLAGLFIAVLFSGSLRFIFSFLSNKYLDVLNMILNFSMIILKTKANRRYQRM